MSWPLISDYNKAVQNPQECFDDPELKNCRIEEKMHRLPKVWAGGFACVYSLQSENRHYAVKCFFGEQGERRSRYDEVSKYLQARNIHYLVDFEYIERGIRVASNWFPILKMGWVEGKQLNAYIEECLGSPDSDRLLGQLLDRLQMMLVTLKKNRIAHGDLQHGNIIVTATGVYLVDYDCMYVPTLKGNKSQCVHCGTFIKWYENIPLLSCIFLRGKCRSCKKSRTIQSLELGHPHYQHPGRSVNDYDDKLDDFSGSVIYTAIRALAVQPNLWDKFTNDENLLFTQNDFKNPHASPLFRELKNLPNSEVVVLTKDLIRSCKRKSSVLIWRNMQVKPLDLLKKAFSFIFNSPKNLKKIKKPLYIPMKTKVITVSFAALAIFFSAAHGNHKKNLNKQIVKTNKTFFVDSKIDSVSNRKLVAMYEVEGDKAYERNSYQEAENMYRKAFNIIKDYSDSVSEDTRRISAKIADCAAMPSEQSTK